MSGIEPNDLYLDVPALRELATLLDGVPELAEDLEDSVSGRARLGAANTRLSGRSSDQPLPFSVGAAKVRDHLHATLVSWVRLICEQRALDYTGDTSTAGLARWLHRNLIALAMTEGAEGAPAEIRMAVAAAERVVCPCGCGVHDRCHGDRSRTSGPAQFLRNRHPGKGIGRAVPCDHGSPHPNPARRGPRRPGARTVGRRLARAVRRRRGLRRTSGSSHAPPKISHPLQRPPNP